MSVPRDHHFIPAFFLEQWAAPDGKLIEYTIKRGKLIAKSVGPRSTGYETDLYAFPELPPETAQFIEQVFWDYADRTGAKAHRMHLGTEPPVWDSELISAWSRFVIGVRLRHPDAMPELRAAARSVWEGSAEESQRRYEEVRKPEDSETFDEVLARRDPLTPVKMRVNLIIKTFDNEILGNTINRMKWFVLDLSAASNRMLLSDRPVAMYLINKPDGILSMPISPTKLFVAANDSAKIIQLQRRKPQELVAQTNAYVVARARRFVWANDRSQERYIRNRMSTQIESTPLYPNIGWPPKDIASVA